MLAYDADQLETARRGPSLPALKHRRLRGCWHHSSCWEAVVRWTPQLVWVLGGTDAECRCRRVIGRNEHRLLGVWHHQSRSHQLRRTRTGGADGSTRTVTDETLWGGARQR